MAVEKRSDELSGVRGKVQRHTDSALHVALTVTTNPVGAAFRLDKVTVHYSANVNVSVTITLDSGAGAAWDTLMRTISLAAAQDGVYIPDKEEWFNSDDAIVVVAPDGGVGVTGAVAIYLVEAGR